MLTPSMSLYMTKQPVTIRSDETLAVAHRIMREHSIRHLPVLDSNGDLCGIVTLRDMHLMETLHDADPSQLLVEQAMVERPFIVTADAPLEEVVQIMGEQKYGSVVIMGKDGLEGIFTAVDACLAFAQFLRRAQL